MIAQQLPQTSRRRDLGHLRRDGHLERGAAAVEMALVLPVLLVVLFGLVDFGRLFNAQMQLTQAAREAVRVKALGGTNADAIARVGVAVGLSPLPTTSFPQTCPAGDYTNNARVTVTYTFHFITPISAVPGIGTTKTLTSNGVMRCAG